MTELPLVLVHGFMGGSDQWELQKELGRDRPLVTLDLPGFADNAALEAPNTINGFAEHVLDELSERNIEHFQLLGHSMGGMIVQEMVALASDRIERLILYGTASTGNLPGRFETFQTSRERVQADGVGISARRISATWFLETEAAEEFENCAAIAERSSMQALQAGLEAMEVWSRTDNLPHIVCPSLIVWGEADRTYRWPQIEELWNNIPDVSLAVMPNCSHAAHLERPDLFNMIVSDFLS
ncbi:MAG: alpha/beta hydrolase [Pseudomonadota bacterium]